MLERNESFNRVLFRSKDKEIKINADSVVKADIIYRNTHSNTHNRLIQIAYKTEGKKQVLVFDLDDDVIRGVLAGLDELVSEMRLKRLTPGIS